MPLEIVTIPCLSDNYAFLARDAATGETAVIDVPEAAPVLAELEKTGWRLTQILLTHHHGDHIAGVAEVKAATGASVVGASADAHRLPPLDLALSEDDEVRIGSESGRVIDVSGHTVGHIAFYFPGSSVVFTADSLMALGCGRVFEGTPPQMWSSLSKLAALPRDTMVCSGHEYTETNASFAMTIEPGNPALQARVAEIEKARAEGRPTVPSNLGDELDTNPFLRAGLSEVKSALGMETAADAEVFAEIRRRKDVY